MDVLMPQLGETVEEGKISAWFKKVGDEVKVDDVLFEVETDKVTTEVPSLGAGVLAEILVPEGEIAPVGAKLAVVKSEAGAEASAAAPAKANGAAKSQKTNGAGRAPTRLFPARQDSRGRPLSPAVRRLLAEENLDPDAIEGSGRNGRITRHDVQKVIDASGAKKTTRARPSAAKPAPKQAAGVVPFSTLRKKIGEHMVRSKATSPHVLQAVEADFGHVDKARLAAKDAWKRREGFSLTYLPFIARAACLAIAEFPRINAAVEGEALKIHERINLGFAVDLDFEGLIAPVVKNAGEMTVRGLARAINDLAAKARENRLSPDDLTEGTYSISNNGSFGTLFTAPIINQPQVAILSTDGVRKKPVVVEGPDGDSIAIRPVGVLAQSFDHRAIDGAYSAAFLRRVKEILATHNWASEI